MQLNEVKALITGGVSGLGLAVARKVIAGGGQAVLLDINDDAGASVVAELGGAASYIRTDVTSEQGVSAAVSMAVDHMGLINVAMNCSWLYIYFNFTYFVIVSCFVFSFFLLIILFLGTIGALYIERPADPLDGFDRKNPVTYHFGSLSPGDNIQLFNHLVSQVGACFIPNYINGCICNLGIVIIALLMFCMLLFCYSFSWHK